MVHISLWFMLMMLIYWVEECVLYRNVHKFLAVELEGQRPLGISRRRSEDNINMDFHEVGWGRGMD